MKDKVLYEILTAGENCWTTEHNGQTKKLAYSSKKAARAALREYRADILEAVKAGDMVKGSYNPDEMEIVETEYVITD